MVNSKDSEPWSFGEEVEDISRNYISLRYQLIPYLYSVFYQASVSGMPVTRTLAIENPFDDQVYQHAYQNQYLFGPFFLVAPVESYKHITRVYLPTGNWFNFHTEETHQGPSQVYVESPISHLPLFIRAGAIIPMQSTVQSTMHQPEPVMCLHLYAGADGEFVYYEDDGSSYRYRDGDYYKRTMHLYHKAGKLVIGEVQGPFKSKFKQIKCCLHGFKRLAKVTLQGNKIKVSREEMVLLPAVSSFDPLGKESISFPVEVQVFVVENSNIEIEIKL